MRTPRHRPQALVRRLRRARLRRAAAALLAGLTVLLVVTALRPADAAGGRTAVVVAVRTIAAGATIEAGDVRVETRPEAAVPEGALHDVDAVVGRTAAGPIAARDAVTPARVVGPGLLDGLAPGQVAMTLPTVPATTRGVVAGSRIDVFATATGAVVAEDALVLAVGAPGDGVAGGAASITLALDRALARDVAKHFSAMTAGESLVIALHGRS